jgi:hypothetical protein
MATMEKSAKKTKKRPPKRKLKIREQTVLTVVSVRISDEEKERIDEIMRINDIKRYSDVLRLAIQMVQVPQHDKNGTSVLYH